MAKPPQEWKVLPHGTLSEIDPNILTVTGKRRMQRRRRLPSDSAKGPWTGRSRLA